MEGIVKWFDRKKGFGFIKCEGKNYFFHISMLEANSKIEEGDKVSFEPKKDPRGIKAIKVRKISERSKR